ncbi:DUF3592 domain-containing protein [Lentibacter sp. XHP0401]|uniref:DUF3592 domain-containing protein n=1 Tax=Lentibacter sp. XHP0401 TaxID=2984334 RepID=UPI0021E8A260|nr:DUF3592 domain-containing protein [Lentibacter sp. XHP0401]MCV2894349.1 DUF3592 domain-containing protein [Lentibacter sp. XHP0401]
MDEPKQTLAKVMWRQQIWVYPLLIAAGIGFAMLKISDYRKAAAFTDHGVKVVGEVTNLHETITNKPNTYDVAYIFPTEADPYNRGNQRVREQLFDTLSDGGPIDIWYLPDDPKQSAVDLGYLTRYFRLALLCSAVLMLTGLVGGWFAIKRARATVLAQGSDS